jgi:hypothetical protein
MRWSSEKRTRTRFDRVRPWSRTCDSQPSVSSGSNAEATADYRAVTLPGSQATFFQTGAFLAVCAVAVEEL